MNWRFPSGPSLKFLTSVLAFTLLLSSPPAQGGELSFKSSTQYLWGDSLLGSNEPFVAEHLRLGYDGDEDLRLAGYGRVAANLGNESVHDKNTNGKLYYMYVDYKGLGIGNLRAGRHFTAYSAGSALLDGVTFDMNRLVKYFGLGLTAGTGVLYGLNSDYTSDTRGLVAANFYLKNIGLNDAGISFARKYDAQQVARETLGFNLASSFRAARPYARGMYNNLTNTLDSLTAGLDIYPSSTLSMKLEYYRSYPTFDSTSIYSVFAVDSYTEYLFQTQYDVSRSLAVNAAYKRQSYQESDLNADAVSLGCRSAETGEYSLTANMEGRAGYGGRIWGAEILGDLAMGKKLGLSFGGQHDLYKRFDAVTPDWQNATRYWLGLRWEPGENARLAVRVENNTNQNFGNRLMGRATLDISF